MPRFNITVTRTIALSRTITVTAPDEDAASTKVEKDIADGKHGADKIAIDIPDGWTQDSDDVDFQPE
jgi:hypothetical protein